MVILGAWREGSGAVPRFVSLLKKHQVLGGDVRGADKKVG
jgi:hypothetical protein